MVFHKLILFKKNTKSNNYNNFCYKNLHLKKLTSDYFMLLIAIIGMDDNNTKINDGNSINKILFTIIIPIVIIIMILLLFIIILKL